MHIIWLTVYVKSIFSPNTICCLIWKVILVLVPWIYEKRIKCKNFFKKVNALSFTTIEKYILNQKFKIFDQFRIAPSEKLCFKQNSSLLCCVVSPSFSNKDEPVTDCICEFIVFLWYQYSAYIISVELKHLVINFYLTSLCFIISTIKTYRRTFALEIHLLINLKPCKDLPWV